MSDLKTHHTKLHQKSIIISLLKTGNTFKELKKVLNLVPAQVKYYKQLSKGKNQKCVYGAPEYQTEFRRKSRIKHLIIAGHTIEQIKKIVNLSPRQVEYYFLCVIYGKYPVSNYQTKLERPVVTGVTFSSKTQQYYPPELYDELNAWKIPIYSFEDLSKSEKKLYNRELPKKWKLMHRPKPYCV